MIDETISLAELTDGMARCVREWILPQLNDAVARVQAEELIALLDALPRSVNFGAGAHDSRSAQDGAGGPK